MNVNSDSSDTNAPGEDRAEECAAREGVQPTCPNCGLCGDRQVRAGLFQGRQRYKCMVCSRRYILDRQSPTLTVEARAMLLGLHRAGSTPSKLAKQLGVDVRTVKSWLARVTKPTPAPPPPPTKDNSERAVSMPPATYPGPPAYRRPTIGQVAERAGVSISTVSNFLNKKRKMSAATHRKIQAAIDALNFRPNALMKAIRENKTGIIGVVLFASWSLEGDLGRSILPPILTGIDQGGEELNLDVLLCTTWSGSSRITADRFLGGHIDGILWVAPGLSEPVLDQVAGEGLPVVGLLSRHVPANVGYVNVDNYLGIKMAVDHLVDTGRSRIAYLGPIFNSNFLDRRDAFIESMSQHGLDLPTNYLMTPLYLPGYSGPPESYFVMLERLLVSDNRPEAIVCADDSLVFDALSRIEGCGLRCPRDIALTGFNDVPDAGVFNGGITTLRQPFKEMATDAVRILKRMVDGDRTQSHQLTRPPTLVCRGTTATAPTR